MTAAKSAAKSAAESNAKSNKARTKTTTPKERIPKAATAKTSTAKTGAKKAAAKSTSATGEDKSARSAGKTQRGDGATVTECRSVLKKIPFLGELSDEDLRGLAPLAQCREYVAGSTIFFEDDNADAVYFIVEGAVEVFKSDGTGRKLPLVVLRDAGVIGEMSLFSREPRSATARTLTSVRLLFIPNGAFYDALDSDNLAAHRLVFGFARVLSQRLNAVNSKLFKLFENQDNSAAMHELTQPHRSLMSEF